MDEVLTRGRCVNCGVCVGLCPHMRFPMPADSCAQSRPEMLLNTQPNQVARTTKKIGQASMGCCQCRIQAHERIVIGVSRYGE